VKIQTRYILIILCALFFSACQKEPAPSFDHLTLGVSGNDLLSSVKYKSLDIEIDYMAGYAPDTSAINKLVLFLGKIINKPNGITVNKHEIPGNASQVMTLANLVSAEDRYRSLYTKNDALRVYILITNGYYSEKDIFATSYWNTSFCVFGKSVNETSGSAGQISRSILMATLFEHEFGHLLGLVNQGSPMQVTHRDAANGAHCNNSTCLMYYNVEAGLVNSLNTIPLLDANCLADLKANGGK